MIKKKHITFLILLSPLLIILVYRACDVTITKNDKIDIVESTPEEQSMALQVTMDFLHKLDRDDFETWDDLSKILHEATTETGWKLLTKTMREASGEIIKRTSYGLVCTEKLPNTPKGRYICIDINSTFERSELIERITTVLEDGKWKIAGYHMSKKISFKNDKS